MNDSHHNRMILLIGFQGYGGRSLNPAEETVKALDGIAVLDRPIRGATLPVRYEPLGARIRSLIEEIGPGIVICLGLWPGEPMIRLERVAVNIADFEIADNEGVQVSNAPIVPGDLSAYETTLPLEDIQLALLAKGIPARLSGSAGQFLCNATMYHALRVCASRQPTPRCGFVHVPYLPEQVAGIVHDTRDRAELELHQRADLASMSREMMAEAIRTVIEVTIEAAVE